MSVKRIQESLLAHREKSLLIAIARCLPLWVTPDLLTVFGVFGALLTGISYAASRCSVWFLWLACFGIVINWFGDSLDGTLARARKIERPVYGFFVDHSTDMISLAFIYLGLGASYYLKFDAACLILMSYWLMALLTFIRAVAIGTFRISYGWVGPTEIRLALFLYTMLVFFAGKLELPFWHLTLIDAFAYALFPVVVISFCVSVWNESRSLDVETGPNDSTPQ
jgi:phosphatidylglycerophosphate synthase